VERTGDAELRPWYGGPWDDKDGFHQDLSLLLSSRTSLRPALALQTTVCGVSSHEDLAESSMTCSASG